MAYMRNIGVPCAACGKRATHEVLGRTNQSYGKYCLKCASAKVDKLNSERQ